MVSLPHSADFGSASVMAVNSLQTTYYTVPPWYSCRIDACRLPTGAEAVVACAKTDKIQNCLTESAKPSAGCCKPQNFNPMSSLALNPTQSQTALFCPFCRMHNGPEAAVVYAQTGRMYNSAREYAKAAHYYKLHIVSNLGNAGLPGENGDSSALTCIAGAYDWHSVQTGELMLCMLCLLAGIV